MASQLLGNPAVSNLVLSLGVMQVARKIDFEDPTVLLYARIGYVVVQSLVVLAYYIASLKIKKKNDMTTLKYVEPPKPMSQEEPAQVVTTVKEYDLSQASQGMRGVLMGAGFMVFMHLYLKYTQPLFVQSIMPLKSLYEAKVLKIHLLGKPATGDLKRPFAQAPGFGASTTPAKEEKVEQKAVKEKKTN